MDAVALPLQTNGLHHGLDAKAPDSPQVTVGVEEDAFSLKSLEAELPVVDDGQIPVAELLSRVVQAIYAELTEFAETMPHMSDAARKRTLADFCVRTKKQVAKLYAVMRWARDADIVQKCMNITAFVMNQNLQLENAVEGLKWTKDILRPAQLRNHDLLTALDVLTTGSYRRLPSVIQKQVITPKPMNRDEVRVTLDRLEDLIRYKLRVTETLPIEMSQYRLTDGRVCIKVPHLFETSLSLRGAMDYDGWFFVNVEFLFAIERGTSSLQDFPRQPTGLMKQFMEDEANAQLALYLPAPPAPTHLVSEEHVAKEQPKLPKGTVDAPLVRLYNFLQMMSLSYQLEILLHQADRIRSLGWSDYLKVETARDRMSFKAHYWIRKMPRSQAPNVHRVVPPVGGVLTISIVPSNPQQRKECSNGFGVDQVLAYLDQRSKMGIEKRPSDNIEHLTLQISWEAMSNALGMEIPQEELSFTPNELKVSSECLDFEGLLLKVIRKHSRAVLIALRNQLLRSSLQRTFEESEVTLIMSPTDTSLQVHLTPEEIVCINLDSRTGRFTLKDTGDLAAAGRGPRFSVVTDRINEVPARLADTIGALRYTTILETTEQKAMYLGLRCFRQRNLQREELAKFGHTARLFLFIQLAAFPGHYLVLVIAEDGYKYALIAMRQIDDGPKSVSVMDDIGWIDISRIAGTQVGLAPSHGIPHTSHAPHFFGHENVGVSKTRFSLDTRFLRELYAYCCARVAHLNVEQQLKESGFPYSHVLSSSSTPRPSEAMLRLHSSLAHLIPALCIKSKDILSGAEAAEAVEENVRIIPLSWWKKRKVQVLTCVKLKHVQSTLGNSSAPTQRLIRPSKSIMYDPQEGIISVLSPSIHGCILHFLAEWSKVSKMVVIAREVSQIARRSGWTDISILSFNLQTVEFVYLTGYALAITCRNESSSKPAYAMRFFRPGEMTQRARSVTDASIASTPAAGPPTELHQPNPHIETTTWLLRLLSGANLAQSIRNLISLLRLSLPILAELEDMRIRFGDDRGGIDWFPKGIAWWRFVFSDAVHALDFRIRSDRLLEISDAGYSRLSGKPRSVPPGMGCSPITPISQMQQICSQISLNSELRVVSFGAGILCSCSAPQSEIRRVVGEITRMVHSSLKSAG